jgi:PGF-CTERM protein
METRSKGKAIIGISMAAIMIASVLAVMVGSVGAYSNGGKYNIIEKIAPSQKVLIGQELDFSGDWGTTPVTVSRIRENTEEWSITADSDNHLVVSEGVDQWKRDGAFWVNWDGTAKTGEAKLTISTPSIPLDLKVDEKKVSSIAVGSDLKVDTAGINLFDQDKVDLAIIGPDGQVKVDVNDQIFTGITVTTLKGYGDRINTDDWKIGDYTFQIKTKPEYACGLDAESSRKDLRIIKGEVAIEADTTSTVELKTVKLTVTGVADDKIKVEGDSPDVVFKEGMDDTPTKINDTDTTPWFYQYIDSDGIRKYAVEFKDTGSYTMTVTVIGGPRDTDYDTVDITVLEKEVEFDMPSSVVIGEKITIKGTATSGTYVWVYVDDKPYQPLRKLVIEDGEFSKEVTSTEVGMNVPGTVRLKAWIDCDKIADQPAGTCDLDGPHPTKTPDGEFAVLLSRPELTAELSTAVVALEDDFTVSGTAKGSREVQMLSIPPKGGGGKSLLTKDKTGLSPRKASVSTTDDTFIKKLSVQEDATSGYYDILVLSSGMDEIWGMTGKSALYGPNGALKEKYGIEDIENGDIGTKTPGEIIDIFDDLVTSPGSDDLMWQGRLKVEEAYVRLDPITAPAAGEPLVVSGTSNRKDGYPIVVTCKGEEELTPVTAKIGNGTFEATFDTIGAPTGEYLVKADDGDGHTDEVEVFITGAGVAEIKEEVEEEITATPAPTLAPTPAPAPTAAPTPEATPKPPGFEAVFAIAGLLAVAYLVLKRKN